MFLLRMISRIPLSVLYILSDILFLAGYHVFRYRRKIVQENLARSFPQKTSAELKKTAKSFYRRLCDYVVETLKLLTISPKALETRMKYTNPELIHRLFDEGHTVIFLASHQFNWEWLLAVGSIHFQVPLRFVFQRVSSSFFERVSLACRMRFGAMPVERNQVAREAMRMRNEVQGIALVADQYPGHGEDKRYRTQFLRQDTAFFEAPDQLAVLIQAHVIFLRVGRQRRGYYTTEAILIATPPYEKERPGIVEQYARETEHAIEVDPAGWLWSHNRWKDRHIT